MNGSAIPEIGGQIVYFMFPFQCRKHGPEIDHRTRKQRSPAAVLEVPDRTEDADLGGVRRTESSIGSDTREGDVRHRIGDAVRNLVQGHPDDNHAKHASQLVQLHLELLSAGSRRNLPAAPAAKGKHGPTQDPGRGGIPKMEV